MKCLTGTGQARSTDAASPLAAPQTPASLPTENRDVVELSAQAQQLLATGNQADPVQTEMVARARKFIDAGMYNDQGVLEATADRLSLVISTEA